MEQASSDPAMEHQTWNQSTNGEDEKELQRSNLDAESLSTDQSRNDDTSESICAAREAN